MSASLTLPIGEETIGRLGIGPVLADQRNALPHCAPDLPKQFAESLAKSGILELGSGEFAISPSLVIGNPPPIVPRTIPQYQAHRAPLRRESGAQQRITSDSSDSRFGKRHRCSKSVKIVGN
jgi:hypothetical protein